MDWWSLGVLVHEMVTGVTPWRHTNIYTLYDMIIDQAFTWDSQHHAGYYKHPVLYQSSTSTPCITTTEPLRSGATEYKH